MTQGRGSYSLRWGILEKEPFGDGERDELEIQGEREDRGFLMGVSCTHVQTGSSGERSGPEEGTRGWNAIVHGKSQHTPICSNSVWQATSVTSKAIP